jgi:hypothetical protein
LIGFLYFLFSAVVSCIFLIGINPIWGDISFDALMNQETSKPFITRVLVPVVLKEISYFLSLESKSSLERIALNSFTFKDLLKIEEGSDLIVEYIFFSLLVFLCFIGFAIVMRKLLTKIHLSEATSDIAPLIGLLILVMIFDTSNYIYDPTVLFFSALLFLFLMNNQLISFSLIFVLSCFNKESSILMLIPFYFFRVENKKRMKVFSEVILLLIIWLVITGYLQWLYRDFSLSPVFFHFWVNVSHFYKIFLNFNLLKHYVPIAIFMALMVSNWSQSQVRYKNSLVCMLMILIPLWILFGRLEELRVFYEIYPLVLLLAVPSVENMYAKL